MRCHSRSAIAHYQEIEHTADHAFHVGGRDLAELLRNSVAVVFALQGTRNEGVPPPCSATSRSAALAGETLLVNWLDELLHL